MRKSFLTLLLLSCCLTCNTDKGETPDSAAKGAISEVKFNKTQWGTKEGSDYPYRDKMLKDIVYNDTIRTLNKGEIIKLLGNPDKIVEDHLYYMIVQKRLGFLPLHTKTMVIKLQEDNSIEWIKIHK